MSEMELSEERKEEVESAMKTRLKREALLCDPQLRRKLSVGENEIEKGVKIRSRKGKRYWVFIDGRFGFGSLKSVSIMLLLRKKKNSCHE